MKTLLHLLLAMSCSTWASASDFSTSRLSSILLSETHAPDLFASLEVPRSGGGPGGAEKRALLFQSLESLARESSNPTLRRISNSVLGEVIGVIAESDPDSTIHDALRILGSRLNGLTGTQFEDDRFGIYDGLARSGQPEAWLTLLKLGTAEDTARHESLFVLSHAIRSLEIPTSRERKEYAHRGPHDSESMAESAAPPHLLVPFGERKTAEHWTRAFAEAVSLLEARENDSQHMKHARLELDAIKQLIRIARKSIESSRLLKHTDSADSSRPESSSTKDGNLSDSPVPQNESIRSAFAKFLDLQLESILALLALAALLVGGPIALRRYRARRRK
jgi:hypothetical protein